MMLSTGLLLVAALLVFWLLTSANGRDWTLARARAALPDLALDWRHAEGRLAGPLVLHDVRIDGDGFELTAARVALDWRWSGLLRRDLTVTALAVEEARVVHWPTEPTEPEPAGFAWPRDLPILDLPLRIAFDEVEVTDLRIVDRDAGPDVAPLQIEQVQSRFVLERDALHIDALDVVAAAARLGVVGQWQSGSSPRIHLEADYRPGHPEAGDSRVVVVASATAERISLQAEGVAPEAFSIDLLLHGLDDALRWRLAVDAPDLQPGLIWPGLAGRYGAQLQASGDAGQGQASGAFDLDGFALTLAPSTARLDDDQLVFDALHLGLLGGELTLSGPIARASPHGVDLTARAQALRWGSGAGATRLSDGEARLSGTLDDWLAQGTLVLHRVSDSADAATATLTARGDRSQARIEALSLTTPIGRADASGGLVWQPAVSWDAEAVLADIDPSYLLADLPGGLSARIQSTGRLPAGGSDPAEAEFALSGLTGRLRGQPVAGRAGLRWRGDSGEIDLALTSGESRLALSGRIGSRLDLKAEFGALQLAGWLPDIQGRLDGQLGLRGQPGRPAIIASDLHIRKLRYAGIAVAHAHLLGSLPQEGSDTLALRAEALDLAGIAVASLSLDAEGRADAMALSLDIDDSRWRISAAGQAARTADGRWAGELSQLSVNLPEPGPGGSLVAGADPWRLDDPAQWSWAVQGFSLSATCLGREDSRVCLGADAGQGFRASARGLALTLTEPWINRNGGPLGQPVRAEGEVSFEADFAQTPGEPSGTLTLRAGPSRWSQTGLDDSERVLFDFLALDLEATLADGRIESRASLRRADDGGLDAVLNTGLAADSALSGRVDLNVLDLAWLELLAPDLVEPKGQLLGRLELSGRRDAPVIAGQARLENFSGELPVLGLRLRDSHLTASATGPSRLAVSGALDTGEGALELTGGLSLDGSQPWLDLALRGENFLAVDNPELRLLASPRLDLEIDANRIQLTGELDIPRARVDLEGIEGGASTSTDVVVLDPDEERAGRQLPIAADLRLRLGDRVQLSGLGLDGRLSGALRMQQATGRDAFASGTLNVSGNYTAFDTVIEIARGRLAYANSPLDSPSLDIRAERRIGAQMAGVQVRGTPAEPRTTLISEPALDSTETLSWLVLGRPLRSAGGDDTEQLGAAAMALGAGGNLLAAQIGNRIGLDLAVEDSGSLGGSAFTVGKHLSPRLLLTYGVSLLGNGQVVGLRYQLPRSFEVEVESGIEQSATLKWRLER
ncbi:MAG: translocation/assembly module TamB domain-containing protein [Xanthomonadaceae bacterium]|nr:translocation/assembly module TamB domain-containing protein [Xanthomonadaceae bacterium]